MEFINKTLENKNLTYPVSNFENDGTSGPLHSYVPAWSRTCVVAFILIAMLIGIPGNTLVTTVLLKLRRRTSTDWFIIFISLTDLFSLVISGSSNIFTIIPEIWNVVAFPFLCKFHIYFTHVVGLLSACLIVCVGVDRYYKTCRPHSTQFTPKLAVNVCVVLTLVSAVFNLSHFFTTKLNENDACVMDPSMANLRSVVYGLLLLFILTTYMALCFLYTKIALKIRERVQVRPSASSYLTTTSNRTMKMTNLGVRSKAKEMHATNIIVIGVQPKPSTSRIASSVEHGQENDTGGSRKAKTKESKSRRLEENVFHGAIVQPNRDQISHSWKQVNKTTKIMGAISVVFVISTFFPAIALAIMTSFNNLKNRKIGQIIIFFMLRFYMINIFANPIFYAWLSSVFRNNAKAALRSCRR